MLLEIKDLIVQTNNGKQILKNLNLRVAKKETHILLGPNASGKSSLTQVIAGNPQYKIISGKILFEGKDITKSAPEKRVKMGIAVSWQNPPAIKGVKLAKLLEKITIKQRKTAIEPYLKQREINVNLSGGEKKITELAQILCLNPKLVVFDEIDSGLDIKKIQEIIEIIKKELISKNIAVLFITHSADVLKFLKPDITNVIVQGKVICRTKDYKKVLQTIKKYNYEKCKKCEKLKKHKM
ncbi:MAG: ATP-binding cassette domain-containing protein [Patescibacteria group bacterium]|nr:ATP-binding cassette domain-containing protein [Patescibacteria group bacterium]